MDFFSDISVQQKVLGGAVLLTVFVFFLTIALLGRRRRRKARQVIPTMNFGFGWDLPTLTRLAPKINVLHGVTNVVMASGHAYATTSLEEGPDWQVLLVTCLEEDQTEVQSHVQNLIFQELGGDVAQRIRFFRA